MLNNFCYLNNITYIFTIFFYLYVFLSLILSFGSFTTSHLLSQLAPCPLIHTSHLLDQRVIEPGLYRTGPSAGFYSTNLTWHIDIWVQQDQWARGTTWQWCSTSMPFQLWSKYIYIYIYMSCVNFAERKNIKITKRTSFMSFSFIDLTFLLNKTHFCTILTSTYAVLVNICLYIS